MQDQALAEEIVLLGELMAAAAQEDRPLSDERVDEVLGVEHRPPKETAGVAPPEPPSSDPPSTESRP